MSTLTIKTRVYMDFADETTRPYTLPDTPESITAAEIETRINAINNGTAINVNDFKATFVSTAGASFISISGAQRITTLEEEIYNG